MNLVHEREWGRKGERITNVGSKSMNKFSQVTKVLRQTLRQIPTLKWFQQNGDSHGIMNIMDQQGIWRFSQEYD